MGNAKKYILTSITLGLIAASGALLIAGTNMITKDRIAENEQKSINNGIVTIFGDPYFSNDDYDVDNYQYVKHVYVVKNSFSSFITPDGYAFLTTGSNNYGKISLIIGFDSSCVYRGLSVIANEQSFASTLKKGYLDEIKDGNKTVDDVSVSCGATYGAKLVREMVNEAKKAVGDLLGVQDG